MKIINKILVISIVLAINTNIYVFAASDNYNNSNVEDQVYNHMENWENKFNFIYDQNSALDLLQSAAKRDDYLERSISLYKTIRVGNLFEADIQYRTTKDQEAFIDYELLKIVNNLIDPKMSKVEMVQAVNDYLVKIYKYDYTYKSDNVYSALTTGTTICQGYAMTAFKMFKILGIDCRIINGEKAGVSHAWNLVKLDNNWYHVDPTNNDNIVRDRYMLKSDTFMKENNYVWNANDYPACVKNFYDAPTEFLDYNYDNDKYYKDYYSGGAWYIDNNKWHYLRLSGYMASGWIAYNDKLYYLNKDGEMQTGWVKINDKWYYFWSDGSLATDTVINGYTVDKNGVCL